MKTKILADFQICFNVPLNIFLAPIQTISCSNIEPILGEDQFDKAIIQVGINNLLIKITSTEGLLQNILKIAARCKTHGISKFFCFKCSTCTQNFK